MSRTVTMTAALVLGLATAATYADNCRINDFITSDRFTLGDAATEQIFSCAEANYKVGDGVYEQLRRLVRDGQFGKADAVLNKALSVNASDSPSSWRTGEQLCVRSGLKHAFSSLHDQMGAHQAQAAEERHPQEAIRVYTTFCRYEQAARVHLKLVKAQGLRPLQESSAYMSAYAYGKEHPIASFREALRQVAAGYSGKLMNDEKTSYARGIYRPDLLAEAMRWLPYAGDSRDGKVRIMTLAQRRGTEIEKKEGCMGLDSAVTYFSVAGKPEEEEKIRAKAMRLSREYERQGAYPAASRCYRIAGASDKADAMDAKADESRRKHAAERAKHETTRKKAFAKGQQDLEKDLGF